MEEEHPRRCCALAQRKDDIERIVQFVRENRNSYASLAVCRRAIDSGLGQVTEPVIGELQSHLEQASDDEIDAYYSIVT